MIFIKDGRQSRLTEDGLRLVEFARRMILLNDETLSAFNGQKEVGHVKLGVPDDYADRLLPQVLAAFNRLNPSIEVLVECLSSARLTEAIREGTLDVAIDLTARPVGQKTDASDESLMGRELFAGVRSLMSAATEGGSFIV